MWGLYLLASHCLTSLSKESYLFLLLFCLTHWPGPLVAREVAKWGQATPSQRFLNDFDKQIIAGLSLERKSFHTTPPLSYHALSYIITFYAFEHSRDYSWITDYGASSRILPWTLSVKKSDVCLHGVSYQNECEEHMGCTIENCSNKPLKRQWPNV